MVNVVMVLLSVLLPLAHLVITKVPWTRRNVLRLFLIYAFVFDVGAVGFLFGFIPHVFFADRAAELIGWPKGSMFQFEVGLHDGAWGILGFLCVFFGGGFWLATAIGWSFFMFGAGWGHVQQIISAGNYAPYNFFPAITDIVIPIWLLGLLYAYWRVGGLDGKLRRETAERRQIAPSHLP
jgi:hypothetical protein